MPTGFRAWTSSIAAVAVSLGLFFVLIAATGFSAGDSARALVDGSLGSQKQVAATVARMLPLILVALAWIVAYKARLFNVGLSGQMIAGGILASVVALEIPLPNGLHLLVGIVAGAVGGFLWVGIATVLWVWRGVNEIISTLLLNFVAISVLAWLVRGPLHGPTVFPQTAQLPETARWPVLVSSAGLNWDVVLVVVSVSVIALAFPLTAVGMRIRLTAANEKAARSAGIRTTRVRAGALLCSGAIAGIAGSSLVLGAQTGTMADGFQGTFGFAGIAVALLARNNPWATVPAAFLFAVLERGGTAMEARVGVASSLVILVQGLVIVAVAVSVIFERRRRFRRVDVVETGDADDALRAEGRAVQ